MREIRLYGKLGEQFGRVHRFDISSPGEAIRAMIANYKDFESALLNTAHAYRVWTGTSRVAQVEDINLPSGHAEIIRIAPVVAGAGKSGLGSILVGAALIAAAVFMPASIGAITVFGSTTVASVVGSIGVAMALGGVAQMLAPQPKQQAGSDDGNSPSYNFNGAVNTTAQGNPVPVGYGRMMVGSAVITASLATEDIPV